MKIQILSGLAALMLISGKSLWAADEKLRLSAVIEKALSQHPSLQAAKARADGANSSVTAVTTLPPPMVGIGMMGENSPWSSSGKMERSYEISQDVPFPTKVISNRNARVFEADSKEWDLEQQRRDIIRDAKKVFFSYARTVQEVEISEERVQLLRKHLKVLASKPVSSSMLQAHVVTIDGEIEAAQVELIMERQELTTMKAELNVAMGQSPDSALATPELPPLSSLPLETRNQVLESPRVKSVTAMKEAAESERSLMYQEWVPDFNLTYRYNRRYDSIPNNHEFMVGMTLPFVPFWSTAAKASQASAKVIELEAELKKTNLETASDAEILRTRAKSLREVYLKLSDKVLPSAEKRLHLIHRISQTDMETLDEHRMAFENLNAIKMKIARTRSDFESAVAELESLASTGEGK